MDANLNRRPDGITLVWPGETEARLQWFGSRGAALGSPQSMRLHDGGNRVFPPDAWYGFSNGAWKIVGGSLVQIGGSGALHTRENFGNFRLVTTSPTRIRKAWVS